MMRRAVGRLVVRGFMAPPLPTGLLMLAARLVVGALGAFEPPRQGGRLMTSTGLELASGFRALEPPGEGRRLLVLVAGLRAGRLTTLVRRFRTLQPPRQTRLLLVRRLLVLVGGFRALQPPG